ncbi:uncharacterized protein LOC127254056 [Andrographis paniculata]|uniref:uncharacterized protein LOC127254056 n=1 Tax=Andrographis paniculata TaxID=175694 RepID=UPI0021E85E14|nr:uncharacterized protein LOC127254056 [Andrographis paniculata]
MRMTFPARTANPPLISSSLFQRNLVVIPCRFSMSSVPRKKIPFQIPARDRVIQIGRYRGKMLGSLPSRYLKWMSKNLRAGDMEEWARLADEVLDDPVYRDRIEWEMVEKILNGDNTSPSPNPSSRSRSNAAAELVEISGRFGWDNEDKQGWSEIDFGLLGTSKGGRIPRLDLGKKKNRKENGVGSLKKGEQKVVEISGGRRRERVLRRRRLVAEMDGGGDYLPHRKERERGGEEGFRDSSSMIRVSDSDSDSDSNGGGVRQNPFPGRQALLDNVLLRRGRRPDFTSSS